MEDPMAAWRDGRPPYDKPTGSEPSPRSIAGLLPVYETELRRRFCGVQYIRETRCYLERLLPLHAHPGDLSSLVIGSALASIAKKRAQRVAWDTLHAFYAWLERHGEVEKNPLDAIDCPRRIQVRLHRRALTEPEAMRLVADDEDALVPFERATFYLVAVTCGLRVGVLRRLRWIDVDFEAAMVRYRKKDQKTDRLKPIPAVTVDRLRRLKAKKRAQLEDRVFRAAPRSPTFYRDLERCKIPRVTAAGELNRHALRVTFCTRLRERGVLVEVAQDLMDHTDPELTLVIYSRFPSAAARDAVERAAPPLKKMSEPSDN